MSPVVDTSNSFQECKILIDSFFSIRQEIIQENSQSINDHIRFLFSTILVDISKQLGEFGDFCKSIQSKNISILDVNFNKLDQLRSVVQVIKYYQPVDQTIADLFAKTDKQFAVIYNIRVRLFVQFREFEKAFADSTRALELDQDSPSSYTNNGIVYLELGLIDKAIEQFNKAISLSPEFEDAYLMCGRAYRKKVNDLIKKVNDLMNRRSITANQREEVKKDITLAGRYFSTTIQLNANNIEALFERGLLYYEIGSTLKAIGDLTKVINSDRKEYFGVAYKYRALSYEKDGQKDKALEDCRNSLEIQPHQPEVIDCLVRLLPDPSVNVREIHIPHAVWF